MSILDVDEGRPKRVAAAASRRKTHTVGVAVQDVMQLKGRLQKLGQGKCKILNALKTIANDSITVVELILGGPISRAWERQET